MERILLCKPRMCGREIDFIRAALAEDWAVPLGPDCTAFEHELEIFVGHNKRVAALVSGTAAVHLALVACGVGPGDEVMVQSFTFCASSHPITYLGATPVFVDSETDTWNMDPQLLDRAIADRIARTGRKPKAIIPVALYGMPYKIDEIMAMAEKYDMPILYSCHPRSRKRLEASGFQLDRRVIAHEPLGFHDYNNLQMNAFAVVSDSGTLPEESSFFLSVGNPIAAVCIRTSTERPEALDKGDFILAGIDEASLLQAVDVAVEMNRNSHLGFPVPNYVDENVSDKIVKLIQSYTGVVNKMVWRKF